MNHQISTRWESASLFISNLDGQEVSFDNTSKEGIHRGVSPKKILLSSLSACTGMDVVAILTNRFKIPFSDFSIDVEGKLTDSSPSFYDRIHIIYQIKTDDAFRKKVEEAVHLSVEKLCGVHAMLAHAAVITHEIRYL
jgi:putative redox protein